MPRGGHFAAVGEPALLVGEMRAFFPTVAWSKSDVPTSTSKSIPLGKKEAERG